METTCSSFVLILVISVLSFVIATETTSVPDLKKSRTQCHEEKCIMKCCPLGTYLTTKPFFDETTGETGILRLCSHFNNTNGNFSSLAENVFYNFPEIANLNFTLKDGIFEKNETFKNFSVGVSKMQFNVYLTEYPKLYLELPNAYNRWTEVTNDRFCWDYKIKINRNKRTVKPGIWVIFPMDSQEPDLTDTTLKTTAMFVSCVFLFIVLVVYAILPELRNLCGQILIAYVASLFTAFLLLAIMRLKKQDIWVCRPLSFSIYFAFMASFCWMHVMSYDIWWTFRGYAKARPIHRRGEHFKFLMYCLYAFGLPLVMTIALTILNEIDMSSNPWFITPKIPTNGCFFEGGEKLVYLYIPMLILILCNWLFFLMTAFNIWRLSRGTAVLDTAAAGTPQAHRTHRHRFMVYLKLSAVMGLNWLLEVVSSLYPDYSVWSISDFYNILIGLTIFLIFVCKRKILKKIIKRYLRLKSEFRPGQKDSMKSSETSDSNSSQETQSLQVCSNPKGPVYSMKLT